MAAVVVAVAHKHMLRFKEQSILACRAGLCSSSAEDKIFLMEAMAVQLVCVGGGSRASFPYIYDFLMTQACFQFINGYYKGAAANNYPIHKSTSCPTQIPFSANSMKC